VSFLHFGLRTTFDVDEAGSVAPMGLRNSRLRLRQKMTSKLCIEYGATTSALRLCGCSWLLWETLFVRDDRDINICMFGKVAHGCGRHPEMEKHGD
jgi:hypothetical protein